MHQKNVLNPTHPGGEKIMEQKSGGCWPVDTPGGRYYAEADMDAPVTREGQLIFFAQFLKTGERWKRLFKKCPLEYIGNQGSGRSISCRILIREQEVFLNMSFL